MRAILLCAGIGSRLMPYTKNTPKCLMKIKGREILDIWICTLINFGIKSILINTHHHHIKIKKFIENRNYKADIVITYEKKLLNTAGTLYKNINFFNNKEGLFIHADNLLNIKLKSFVKAHKKRPKKCLITMLCFNTNKPKECGIVKVDKKNIVINYFEKKDEYHGNFANGAIYILSKKFINIIKSKKNMINKNFTADILNAFINEIYAYK
ncbi:nucleotidyltransferase family protein, partial [Alphaproteobacteria bacterium]|nr:nucleotidyltransferase family protein [Alphaproteobacteria bacterium]